MHHTQQCASLKHQGSNSCARVSATGSAAPCYKRHTTYARSYSVRSSHGYTTTAIRTQGAELQGDQEDVDSFTYLTETLEPSLNWSTATEDEDTQPSAPFQEVTEPSTAAIKERTTPRRGRPRKQHQQTSAPLVESPTADREDPSIAPSPSTTNQSTPTPSVPPPRRRGRPRKVPPPAVTPPSAGPVEAPHTPPPPATTAQPSDASNPFSPNAVDDINSFTYLQDPSQPIASFHTSPAGSHQPSTAPATTADSHPPPTPSTTPPRRRGRPTKLPQPSATHPPADPSAPPQPTPSHDPPLMTPRHEPNLATLQQDSPLTAAPTPPAPTPPLAPHRPAARTPYSKNIPQKLIDLSDTSAIPGLEPTALSFDPPALDADSDGLPHAYSGVQSELSIELVDPWATQQIMALQTDLEHDFQLTGSLELHNLRFSDPMATSSHFYRVLRHNRPHVPLAYDEQQQLLALLRAGHQDPESKLGTGVDYVFVGQHPTHNSKCFMLKRTDGSVVDFSYRKCISNLYQDSWDYYNIEYSAIAVLRSLSTIFLTLQYHPQDVLAVRNARQRLKNLYTASPALPETPSETLEAALIEWQLEFMNWQGGQGDASNAAHALQAFARLSKADALCRSRVVEAAAVPEVMQVLYPQVAKMSSQDLVNIVWELYSLRYNPPTWLEDWLPGLAVELQEVNDCVRLVEAVVGLQLASAGTLVPVLLQFCEKQLLQGQPLGAHYLVSLLGSCAKLGPQSDMVPSQLPRLLLHRLEAEDLSSLHASQVIIMLWATPVLQLRPSDDLLNAAATVGRVPTHPALIGLLWSLLGQHRHQPNQAQLSGLQDWIKAHAVELHPRGLRRLAWFLGLLAAEEAVPFGSELAVTDSVAELVRLAGQQGEACPLPTAVACLWAAAVLGCCEEPGFMELWQVWNGDPKRTYEQLTLLPQKVRVNMLLQALRAADILEQHWERLQLRMHPRLRKTALAAAQGPPADRSRPTNRTVRRQPWSGTTAHL